MKINEYGNETVCEYVRKSTYFKYDDGDTIWQAYRLAGEMLAIRKQQIEKKPERERYQKRFKQAKENYAIAKKNLEEFAQINNIQLMKNGG